MTAYNILYLRKIKTMTKDENNSKNFTAILEEMEAKFDEVLENKGFVKDSDGKFSMRLKTDEKKLNNEFMNQLNVTMAFDKSYENINHVYDEWCKDLAKENTDAFKKVIEELNQEMRTIFPEGFLEPKPREVRFTYYDPATELRISFDAVENQFFSDEDEIVSDAKTLDNIVKDGKEAFDEMVRPLPAAER